MMHQVAAASLKQEVLRRAELLRAPAGARTPVVHRAQAELLPEAQRAAVHQQILVAR